MPTSGDPLARRYRRLLLCYPRAYRRSRGEEIVATLLDAAPPGRTRPTLREMANLIRHGLRARLGRPASPTVVVWAALAATICGLFTAALATRAAWETARPVPDRREAGEILTTVLPEHGLDLSSWPATPEPAHFVVYTEPLTWSNVNVLLFGDGGEYEQNSVGVGVTGKPPVGHEHTVAVARHRLRETGWQVDEPMVRNAVDCADDRCDPATLPTTTTVIARRGDTIFELWLNSQGTDPRYSAYVADITYLSVSLRRATPPAVYPAGVVGGLLGATAAWLLFGWASRRTEGRRVANGAVKVVHTITLLVWWPPVLLAVPHLISHQVGEPHPQWHPLWEWLGQPTFSLFFLVGCASALLGLVIAALPRRGTNPLPTVATG